MGAREAEDRRPADVLTGEVDRADVQRSDELVQVLGRCRAVVVARPVGGIAEARQVYREDAVAGREQWDELAEGPPSLGNPWTSRIGDPLVPADT
jgi:hypothetical protein